MIGQEDLAMCFVQARIARHQAKSLLVVALFLKLTREKLSCLNSQKNANRKELTMKKKTSFCNGLTLSGMTSHCNGCVAFKRTEEKNRSEMN